MINLLKNPQNKAKKIVALIDGEHYPQINLDAISLLKKFFPGSFGGLIFLGGTEKLLSADLEEFYGCRVIELKNIHIDFLPALDVLKPDIVYDLSDEPVVNYFTRMQIASFCFIRACSYMGPDFYFEYEPKRITLSKPSLMIFGTGKRIGKTAVSAYISKELSRWKKICIVAMGRGGPEKPQVLKGSEIKITPDYLLSISRKGLHASSDYIEDAMFTNLDTVGCRRCGGGFGGKFFLSNIDEGVKLAEKINPEIIVVEGSGASIPPVRSDYNICVIGANQDWQGIVGYLGIYRLVISDMVFMTMCEEPVSQIENVDYLTEKILELKKDAKIIKSVFRPEPLYSLKGRKVFLVLTANRSAEYNIRNYLEEKHGCSVVKTSFNLSDRKKLYNDLNSFNDYSMLLTELKAASVDVVTEYAVSKKKEINYFNNIPVILEGADHLKYLFNELKVNNGKK